MDLGLSNSADFLSSGSFSPEEIQALINPTGIHISTSPSAIQVLLNQGAEYLCQKNPFELNALLQKFSAYLKTKSDKIQSIVPIIQETSSVQNPLVYTFDIGTLGHGLIALDWRLSYVLIDALLGGINGVSIEKRQDEPYSVIEQNVLMPVIRHLLSLTATDRNVLINAIYPSTTVPVPTPELKRFSFLVRTPVSSGKMILDLPASLVPHAHDIPLISETALSHIPVQVQAVISGIQTSLADVLTWQAGTELSFGRIDELLTDIAIAGKTIAYAKVQENASERRVCVEAV